MEQIAIINQLLIFIIGKEAIKHDDGKRKEILRSLGGK